MTVARLPSLGITQFAPSAGPARPCSSPAAQPPPQGRRRGRPSLGAGFGEAGRMIANQVEVEGQFLDLVELGAAQLPPLSHLAHPVNAYLNGLTPSSRRPQLAALEAIARRSTQVYSAETMPWQRLRRPHALQIRSLLEEKYRPSSANRMLAALRGVLRECWHAGLISTDDYQGAISVKAVRGESSCVAVISQPGSCAAFSRPAPVRPRNPRISRTQERAGAGTPPSWPSPTAPGSAAPRRSRSTWPTSTSPRASSGSARARARSPASRPWPRLPSQPLRIGCRFGAATLGPLLRRVKDRPSGP